MTNCQPGCGCTRCDQRRQCDAEFPVNSAQSATINPITQHLIRRLITCADDGYDTAELNNIAEDAKKAVGK